MSFPFLSHELSFDIFIEWRVIGEARWMKTVGEWSLKSAVNTLLIIETSIVEMLKSRIEQGILTRFPLLITLNHRFNKNRNRSRVTSQHLTCGLDPCWRYLLFKSVMGHFFDFFVEVKKCFIGTASVAFTFWWCRTKKAKPGVLGVQSLRRKNFRVASILDWNRLHRERR